MEDATLKQDIRGRYGKAALASQSQLRRSCCGTGTVLQERTLDPITGGSIWRGRHYRRPARCRASIARMWQPHRLGAHRLEGDCVGSRIGGRDRRCHPPVGNKLFARHIIRVRNIGLLAALTGTSNARRVHPGSNRQADFPIWRALQSSRV
jgi:hypothetical protein